jgi:hypothetical protein
VPEDVLATTWPLRRGSQGELPAEPRRIDRAMIRW